jgi:hypothetical protein
MQSADVAEGLPTSTKAEVTQAQTVTFMDETSGLSVGTPAPDDHLAEADAVTGAGLSEFLARPVRVATFTWNESDAIGTTLSSINPWQLFFNDARIKFKLNNFGFVKCNLKVKVLINASPFYYGALKMIYQPLPNFTPSTILNDAGTRYLIPYSQRPGLWIYPQDNEGGEMVLPFFYQKNWLRAQVSQDFADMGRLDFINYTQLQSANGVTGTGVTVQVFTWAENVVISGPSIGLAMQSSDEYGEGVVSRPASAVANIAGLLKGIPIIGKFATATEMGARAVAGVAKLFGYTNVPVIADTMPLRPSPFPQLSSPEIGYPVEKLTLDSKNELSIDPSAVGLPGHDELAIDSLIQRESYLTTATWSTSSTVDTILFSSRVTPFLFDADGSVANSKMYFTPIAWIANLFQNWRGDIIFRFRFIASPFHKGRVKISYDPQGYAGANILNTADTSAAVYTQIVDLGVDSDVEIRVPYQQALGWLQTNTSFNTGNIPFSTSASPSFAMVDSTDNGTISMRVVTTVTAPVSTSNVPVIISVRAADNMEYANPLAPGTSFTSFPLQSADVDEPCPTTVVTGTNVAMLDPDRYKMNFGECVRSLRPLLRRSNLVEVNLDSAVSGSSVMMLTQHTFGKYPLYYGYDPAGVHSAKGTLVPLSNFAFNYVQPTPYHWIAPAFIAQKGAGMWHFNIDNVNPIASVSVVRANQFNLLAGETKAGQAAGTVSANARFFLSSYPQTSGGVSLTSQYTNAGLSVSCPNYTNYKFQSTRPQNTSQPSTVPSASAYDGSDRDTYKLLITTSELTTQVASNTMKIWKYFGVGTDYSLYYFLNVPTFLRLPAIPTAN